MSQACAVWGFLPLVRCQKTIVAEEGTRRSHRVASHWGDYRSNALIVCGRSVVEQRVVWRSAWDRHSFAGSTLDQTVHSPKSTSMSVIAILRQLTVFSTLLPRCSDYYFDRRAFSLTSFSQSSASLELDRDAFSEVFMIPLSPANSSGVSWSKLARSGGFEVKLNGSVVGARECCGSQF